MGANKYGIAGMARSYKKSAALELVRIEFVASQ